MMSVSSGMTCRLHINTPSWVELVATSKHFGLLPHPHQSKISTEECCANTAVYSMCCILGISGQCMVCIKQAVNLQSGHTNNFKICANTFQSIPNSVIAVFCCYQKLIVYVVRKKFYTILLDRGIKQSYKIVKSTKKYYFYATHTQTRETYNGLHYAQCSTVIGVEWVWSPRPQQSRE